MNQTILEDVTYLANGRMIPWDRLREKSFFITGATGLLGSQVVLALDQYNKMYDGRITIYALVRNMDKARKWFGECTDYVRVVQGDITQPITLSDHIDYVIHGASMTSSKDFVDLPVETIMTGINGTNNLLSFARQKGVRGFLYLSSLEAYGTTDPKRKTIKEEDSGYINQLSVRSSYSEGKRIAECLCISYASEYKVPVKIVRPCQTFGPGVAYSDNRVFAQFARSAIEGTDIILKTKGETFRNYCYTSDAVTGMLKVLLDGDVGEAYNLANPDTGISICDMAQMFADEFSHGRSKVVFDIAEDATKLGYNPVVKIRLDTKKLERLGWKAEVDLKTSCQRLIEYMEAVR